MKGQLDYLQDAASRMGRIDWRNAVTGVLLGTVVNAALPGDAVRDALLTLLAQWGTCSGTRCLSCLSASRRVAPPKALFM